MAGLKWNTGRYLYYSTVELGYQHVCGYDLDHNEEGGGGGGGERVKGANQQKQGHIHGRGPRGGGRF
jgi:hypothetical protein